MEIRKISSFFVAFLAVFGGGNAFISEIFKIISKYNQLPLELQDLVYIVGIILLVIFALFCAVIVNNESGENKPEDNTVPEIKEKQPKNKKKR